MTGIAYSYIRFSSAIQQTGDSFRRQLEATDGYAKQHGLTLDSSLNMRDLGISAFDGSNLAKGALGAFVEAVECGKVKPGSYLLVESLDRISRAQVTGALQLFLRILGAGIIIVTLADNQVYSQESLGGNPYQLIGSISVMIRAHEESLTKSRRINAAWTKKREAVESVRLTRMCPNWLMPADTGFSVIEEKAESIRRIFELKAGGQGKQTIAKTLNLEGVPTLVNRRMQGRQHEKWHPNTIAQILAARTVLGEFQPHTGRGKSRVPVGDPIPNYYPRIISDEQWAASRPDEGRRRSGRNASTMRSIFRGLLRCPRCGGTVTTLSSSRKGVIHRNFGCYNYQRGACNSAGRWEYGNFLQRFAESIDEIDLEGLVYGDRPDPVEPLRIEVVTLKNKIAETEKWIDNLLDSVESGASKGIAERLARREAEKEKLEHELQFASAKLAEVDSYRGNVERNLTSIRDALRILDDDASADMRIKINKMLYSLISHINVHVDQPRMSQVVYRDGLSTVILQEPWVLSNGITIGCVSSNFTESDFPDAIYQQMLEQRKGFERLPSFEEDKRLQREWDVSPEAQQRKQEWAENWAAIIAEADACDGPTG